MLTVIFRCDASSEIGFGHLMRCLALAEAASAQGERVRFLTRAEPSVERRLRESGLPASWLPARGQGADVLRALHHLVVEEVSRQAGPVWVVVDSYDDGQGQSRRAREAGAQVLVIDDLGVSGYEADLLLNFNLDATQVPYDLPEEMLLLGPRYALLRQEFLEVPHREPRGAVRRILVALGGSDRRNRVVKVLKALERLPRIHQDHVDVEVVVGPGYRWREALETLVPALSFRCRVNSAVEQMAAVMAQADLAIIAAGTTAYEVARLGIPMVLLVLAENQRRNAEAFAQHGVGLVAGDAAAVSLDAIVEPVETLLADPQRRNEMSARGPSLIDGQGAHRVWEAMSACASVKPKAVS